MHRKKYKHKGNPQYTGLDSPGKTRGMEQDNYEESPQETK